MLIPEQAPKCQQQVNHARLPRSSGQAPLQAAQASGEEALTKPRQPFLGERGFPAAGGTLTWPRKPPGSGRRQGQAAGTATLPSSLRPGKQASREQGQRPGALPPAGSPGRAGRRPGLVHCRGEQLLASVTAAAAGSCGSGRSGAQGAIAGEVCAREGGQRAPKCVHEGGRRAAVPGGARVSA